jgi:hypothetical protein
MEQIFLATLMCVWNVMEMTSKEVSLMLAVVEVVLMEHHVTQMAHQVILLIGLILTITVQPQSQPLDYTPDSVPARYVMVRTFQVD